MRYSKPHVTSTLNAASTIHQVGFTENPQGGVYKIPAGHYDNQRTPSPCSPGAYEADE
jgi:hypothetical protein